MNISKEIEALIATAPNSGELLEKLQSELDRGKTNQPHYKQYTVERVDLMYIIPKYAKIDLAMVKHKTDYRCDCCGTGLYLEDTYGLAITYGKHNGMLCETCANELITRYPELTRKTPISVMEK